MTVPLHHGSVPPPPRRSQEDIRQRREMAAGYYALRGLQSILPLPVAWSELSWAEQERFTGEKCGGET